ncbi:MAG: 16S rRNA (guanine(966)-N(2))-methyltransferase RsmD [Elusimicrobia bacterium]|nr:16S rRNA (guanine(966)-N(2))-methyltransferase RsmD [Elusimicrobiota bacterium]
MRIIAGKAKGRRILSLPKKSGLRPIMARIRQSLFDIVRTKVPGAYFLDLFAGTGAVGLEALSRGSERVAFVDKNPQCLKVIEKNVARAGFKEKAFILRADAREGLSWLLHRTAGTPFDLIFFGPPYWEQKTSSELRVKSLELEKRTPLKIVGEILARIDSGGILAVDGWIVAQHQKKETYMVPESLEMFRQSKYGDSMLSFFRYKNVELGP